MAEEVDRLDERDGAKAPAASNGKKKKMVVAAVAAVLLLGGGGGAYYMMQPGDGAGEHGGDKSAAHELPPHAIHDGLGKVGIFRRGQPVRE